MKIKALIAALMFVCAPVLWAQGKPLACQVDGSVGLDWDSGQWKVKRFHLERFVLVMDKENLTTRSVLKALNPESKDESEWQVSCQKTLSNNRIRCEDFTGSSIYYDPNTNKGGKSSLHGATLSGSRRDSVSLDVFTCQPF